MAIIQKCPCCGEAIEKGKLLAGTVIGQYWLPESTTLAICLKKISFSV